MLSLTRTPPTNPDAPYRAAGLDLVADAVDPPKVDKADHPVEKLHADGGRRRRRW
jgi:hypothetical protein